MTCKAKQYSDQMQCDACGLSWDMNDPEPPKCRQDVACAVCEGEAGAVKIGRFDLCLDPRCADVAKVWITRQPDGSTYWESEAIKTGGKAGGAYLQTLGVYDLSKLTPDQYGTFAKTLVQSYRAELRRQGALKAPPF
jgi:hypothetical protein